MPVQLTETELAEIELCDRVFADVKAFAISLQNSQTDTDWFLSLLLSLVNCTLREYRHLKIGYRKYNGLLAWACRNLLELNIFTKYVLGSEANAKEFIGHRLVDGIEIMETFRNWARALEPEVDTPELDETIQNARREKAEEEVTATRFLSVSALASAVGMADEYKYMNKISSKLVHSTAWSVLTMNDEGEYRLFSPIMFRAGSRYGIELYGKMTDHVEAFGVRPIGSDRS